MDTNSTPDNMYLDTSFLLWLNKQADDRNNEEWMLDAFLFLLRKITLHEKIRLDRDSCIHQRFWKGMEYTFEYRLLGKNKKPRDIVLYRFMESVALMEGWIEKKERYACVTQKGEQFLTLKRKAQWNRILEYIWPDP